MRFNLRFWAENITPPEVVERGLSLLQQYGAGVAVAVYPESLTPENAQAFRALKQGGVELVFWPLLERESGYFPGERNVPLFEKAVQRLLAWAEEQDAMPDMLAFDLEMPLGQMETITGSGFPLGQLREVVRAARDNLDRERYYAAKAELAALHDRVQDRGLRTITAVMPWVALEMEGECELVQDMSETPATGIGWDVVSPMMYASMIDKLSGGIINAADADWLIYDMCLRLRGWCGGRAGVSLGIVGGNVLDEDWSMQEPGELITGLQAALAAGIRDVSVFCLEGVLSRPDPHAWLEPIVSAHPCVPERSRKVAGGLSAVRAVYPTFARVVDWYRRG